MREHALILNVCINVTDDFRANWWEISPSFFSGIRFLPNCSRKYREQISIRATDDPPLLNLDATVSLMNFRIFERVCVFVCQSWRERERERVNQPACVSLPERFPLRVSPQNESSYYCRGTCRQIVMAAGYQRTSRSKNTLQMTSFCAPTVAPLFSSHQALLHLQRRKNLLPPRHFSLMWQWGEQVADRGVVTLFCVALSNSITLLLLLLLLVVV